MVGVPNFFLCKFSSLHFLLRHQTTHQNFFNSNSIVPFSFLPISIEPNAVSKFSVQGKYYCIQYESLHPIYFRCGKYGHTKEICPEKLLEIHHERSGCRKMMCRERKPNNHRRRRRGMVAGEWPREQEDLGNTKKGMEAIMGNQIHYQRAQDLLP